MNRADTKTTGKFLDTQIEVRRVDTHQHVRRVLSQSPPGIVQHLAQARQVPQDFEQAHDSQFLAIPPCSATRSPHRRTGDAFDFNIRMSSAQGADQTGAQLIARGFARDDCDTRHRWN